MVLSRSIMKSPSFSHWIVYSFELKNSVCEKRLGIKFDSKLRFNQHITDLCRRVSRKIQALARVTPFVTLSKRRLLMNSFFKMQFNYCPLIWMCHSRENNRKINRLHERCLRTIYNDNSHHLMNYWKKMVLSRFMNEISKFSHWNV